MGPQTAAEVGAGEDSRDSTLKSTTRRPESLVGDGSRRIRRVCRMISKKPHHRLFNNALWFWLAEYVCLVFVLIG